MIIASRNSRDLTKIKTQETARVDIGQSWKIWDSTTIHKTCMFFNGAGSYKKGERDVPRIVWAETDRGGFLIEDEEDYVFISSITGLGIEKIREICKIRPCDTVTS